MGVFSNIGDSSVFKNESVLSTEHVPTLLPHRENEIKRIARNIMPVSKGRKAQNTFIFGSPGIGKTAVVKNVFKEFEDYSDNVKCIYINCWDYKTPTALLTQIVIELGMFAQRRGWSKDEIIGKLVEAVKNRAKGVVVCLDEVDQLDMSALYDLLRINQYVKTPLGIVFISNDEHVFSKAEARIRSSMGLEEIKFKPYNFVEMKDILTERADNAFRSFDSAAVVLCANQAVRMDGDVRVGLQCLLKAGRLAEDERSSKLTVKHAKAVVKVAIDAKPKILESKISDHERIILKVLKDEEKRTAGQLYEEYCEQCEKDGTYPVTDRAVRDFVNHLAEIKLINISEKKIGKSRMIWRN